VSEPLELNEVLQGKKILSIELGTTPGWMLVNLGPQAFYNCEHGERVFLTVFVGGRSGSSNDKDYYTCALHYKKKGDVWRTADPVRDGRDPGMPMARAIT
jgi:hypothetical protein